MDGLILEPYAARLQLTAPTERAHGQWAAALTRLFDHLAQGCEEADGSVIGHIKALARFPRERYLRISVVAAEYPAAMEGRPPGQYRKVELTLNVLVYGIARKQLAQIVKAAIAETITDLEVRLFAQPEAFPMYGGDGD